MSSAYLSNSHVISIARGENRFAQHDRHLMWAVANVHADSEYTLIDAGKYFRSGARIRVERLAKQVHASRSSSRILLVANDLTRLARSKPGDLVDECRKLGVRLVLLDEEFDSQRASFDMLLGRIRALQAGAHPSA